MKMWAALCVAFLTGWPMAAPAQTTHTLPLVRPADFAGQESLVRIVNRSATSGTVQVTAIDDTGRRFGPVTLTLGARQALNITSTDWERGNAAKGLPVGVGDGSGNWRLDLATDLTIEPLAYIRTPDGFLTSMHDVAPESEGGGHWVPFFNPGSSTSKVSHLRIINPGTAAAAVTVTGRDDGGNEASGTVRLTLAAGASRTLTAQALEAGGEGFDGSLSDGAGKWRLSVTSSADIRVMSLLSTQTQHLASLSTSPSNVGGEPPPEPPGTSFRDCPECPEMVVVPGGSFVMGKSAPEYAHPYVFFSDDSYGYVEGDELPRRRVSIPSFAVGKYEVTWDEWEACETAGGCSDEALWRLLVRIASENSDNWFIENEERNHPSGWLFRNRLRDNVPVVGIRLGRGRLPVVNVTWFDTQLYVRWLSEKTGEEYRLLSESEWEYAARAGTKTPFHTGKHITPEQANIDFRQSYFTPEGRTWPRGGVFCTEWLAYHPWCDPLGGPGQDH